MSFFDTEEAHAAMPDEVADEGGLPAIWQAGLGPGRSGGTVPLCQHFDILGKMTQGQALFRFDPMGCKRVGETHKAKKAGKQLWRGPEAAIIRLNR
jgi:hypothetical protein